MPRMRRMLPTLSCLLFLACATTPTAPTSLAERIDAILAAHPDQTIAVSWSELGGGRSLLRNEREVFHAASTMKVPVMLGIFEAISRGELQLDQPVSVRNQFVSIYDGSGYALDPQSDSDSEIYARVGGEMALEELVRRMIVRSSNLATNLTIELIGAPRVMALMKEIGAHDVRVLRGVEDQKAFDAGMNNTTTAHDLMLIFRTLAEGKVISREASAKMVEILLAQEHRDGIPAGVPEGTSVAHKTGSITRISHDAGIITRPNGSRYVLVVLTRGFEKGRDAQQVIAEVSRAVWDSR
jgi:beta-lactamase class A